MDRSILVNTWAGIVAQAMREHAELLRTAIRSPETLGTFANDLIARSLLERLCRPGGVFLDVGAHIGSVIDGARRHSRPAAVIAFEAIASKADALRRRFPDVEVHGCALGEIEGELPFFIDIRRSGYSSLNARADASPDTVREVRVPVRRLDDLVPAETPVDLIKIDVEGAELGVLRGGQRLIAAARPVIMFESGPEEMGGYTKDAIWRWFDEADYAVLLPNRVGHEDGGLSREGFIEAHLHPRRTTNYFAVPRARRAEIHDRARAVLGLG